MVIYTDISEEILEFAISKLFEKNHQVQKLNKKLISKKDILITDKSIIRDKTIVIFEEIVGAVFSTSKIKILKNSSIHDYKEALEAAKTNFKYSSSEICNMKSDLDKFQENFKNLTSRHRQLISEIYLGSTNLQIAKKLYISEKTVKNNLTDLYKIMNVKNRIELIKKCKIILTVKS